MGEDKLDKINNLCYLINRNKKINISFQVGYYYDGIFNCGLSIDNKFEPYRSIDHIIDTLEDLYLDNGTSQLKKELLRDIDNLQYVLNKYQETLAKLEEKHNAV